MNIQACTCEQCSEKECPCTGQAPSECNYKCDCFCEQCGNIMDKVETK